MKSIFLVLLGLGLSLSTNSASAADMTTCPDKVERRGSIQIQQYLTRNNVCFFSVGNHKTLGGIYRNYLFTSDGEFMIFNSYGWGDDSSSTGAREYFFFPRTSSIAYNWNDESRQLEVSSASGDKFFFDYDEAQLVSMDKGQVRIAEEVRKDNKGGVEILSYQGLLMDGGFKIGSAPTSNRNGASVFKDATGGTCTLKNSSIFKYESDGNSFIKFNDAELTAYLKKTCSRLKP